MFKMHTAFFIHNAKTPCNHTDLFILIPNNRMQEATSKST